MYTSLSRVPRVVTFVTICAMAFVPTLPSAPAHADSMPAMQMDNTADHHHATTAQFAFGAPAQAGEATRIIQIKMVDMIFDPPTVAVRPGRSSAS
jgi:hypothetical protein